MNRRRSRRNDDGQVVITFALTMALFLFGMIALVIDISTLYAARATAIEAAQDGAVAGASNVDIPAFITSGSIKLKMPAAQVECEHVSAADARAFSAFSMSFPSGYPKCANTAGNPSITASVKMSVSLPVPMPAFGSSGTVTGCYTAAAQGGTTVPFTESNSSAACP